MQDAEAHPQHQFLNRAKVYELRQSKKTEPENVQAEESTSCKGQEAKVLFGKNAVNQPLHEQGIEKKHQAAQNNQQDTEGISRQKRLHLTNEPLCLRLKSRIQRILRALGSLTELILGYAA